MSESRIKRIQRMEAILDEANEAIEELDRASGRYIAVQKKIDKLAEYYSGALWKSDFEYDEKGKLPADLKRGVLSEDAVFDMLDRNKKTAEAIGLKKSM